MQVHGARRQEAVAGERVAVNLAGVEVADIARGQALVDAGHVAGDAVIDASSTCCLGAGR